MGILNIGVLGAGVVGLTSTLQLLDKFPNCNITIIADKFNQDTTSDGAAGIFRPGTSFSGPSPEITRQWLVDSYDWYSELLNDNCGVSPVSGYIFSSTSLQLVKNHLLEGLVPVYRPARSDELSLCPGGWKYGSYFETLLIECRAFLPWALHRAQSRGVSVVRQHVDSLAQLQSQYDVVLNCSGLGSKLLLGDHKLVPIRGQVIKVHAPWVKHFYYADYDTYIIPGSGGVVTLGGSRHYDSHHTEACGHDAAAIRERCLALVPSLATATTLGTWTGLRPHRDTVRVQAERVGNLTVIHNYGHGGYGVTAAPGTAKYAVHLLQHTLMGNCKL
ncbi:D-aspartate oxidase-like [Macrosteles quadrilineatus]|uniref:D-aspartate oxidase-like n=1 Tax=Macrosteles quadrilineatus TaxID=74068 RepID=UPI0023E0D773|nr:D-aspartate oxidase-like [Macrosteles quadrilineatus]